MTDILREKLIDLNVASLSQQRVLISEIVSYFDRQTDHEQIRESIKTRYGQGIRREKDPDSDVMVETYVRTGFSEEVDAGIIEALAIGFGNKVVNARATLFTERGQKFTIVHPEESTSVENAEALLNQSRKKGGFKREITRANKKAEQSGSSFLLMSFQRDHVTYQALSPDVITVYFGEYIIEDNNSRTVVPTDIEDASVVIIRLSQVDVATYNYLAIFGRSENLYPDGRYTTFQGPTDVVRVPAPYQEGAIEYEIDGVMCNPLSKIANENPDMEIPEYPIAVFKSGTTDAATLFPISTSLYEDSKEFDVAAGHLLSVSQDAARGSNVILRDESGMGKPLPRSLHGDFALESGMNIEHISHGAADSVSALEVLKDLMVELASGYSVPDYMVVSEDHALEASSGVALQVKTRQLKKAREESVEINTPSVEKVFQVEKALIWKYSTEPEADKNTLFVCDQLWDAGELVLPENKKEASERIIALMDKGILDTIAAIREYYQFSTDEEAIEVYEKMKERKDDYPSLAAAPKKTLGLPGRTTTQQNQQGQPNEPNQPPQTRQ